MTWFFLVIIGFFFVQIARSAWKARRPEGVRLGNAGRTANYLLALASLGVAVIVLFNYAHDTTSYWRLPVALVWLLIGATMATTTPYGLMSNAQRDRMRRILARQWWVGPALLIGLIIGLVPLAVLAPRWILATYMTAFFCAMAVWLVWYWRVLREPGG